MKLPLQMVMLAATIGLCGACGAAGSSSQTSSLVNGKAAAPSVANLFPRTGAKVGPGDKLPAPDSFANQPGIAHHSGGPYLTPADIQLAAAKDRGCAQPFAVQLHVGIDGGRCTGVSVSFYPRVDAALAARPDWQAPSADAADREIYLVTIHGRLHFFPISTRIIDQAGYWADHWNEEVDPTTGAVLGGGTAGTPFP